MYEYCEVSTRPEVRYSLWKITRNSTGNEFDRGWTSAGVRNQPDVSQPYVVGFRCGKVENLGGRMRRMKKRGPNVLYDLNDLLFFLTVCCENALYVYIIM